MVTFPDRVHPKHGLTMRFLYAYRGIQYLEYFDIIKNYPTYNFFPLNLTFANADELHEFLIMRGIIHYEVEVSITNSQFSEPVCIVNTKKIYNAEESISKYLLNYKYYSINEVAEMLSFSRPTVYKLVNDQKLKAVRIYGQLRINHMDLIYFINKK